MVNAATDIKYGKDFYKEGTKLPDNLVEHFKLHDLSLLDNYIEINGTWKQIDDSTIAGFVEENKKTNYRIRKYFERLQTKDVEIPEGKEFDDTKLKEAAEKRVIKKKGKK